MNDVYIPPYPEDYDGEDELPVRYCDECDAVLNDKPDPVVEDLLVWTCPECGFSNY